MDRPLRDRTPITYSEMLRLMGAYVDQHHLTEVRILETAEGMILQGLATQGQNSGERVTYQLTAEDVQMLLDNAIAQRVKRLG